jgi:hypothetical protein
MITVLDANHFMNNKRDRDDYKGLRVNSQLTTVPAFQPLGELRLHSLLGIVHSLGIGKGKPTMGDGHIGISNTLTRASLRESSPAKARVGTAGRVGVASRAAVVVTSPRRIQQQLQWTMKDPPPSGPRGREAQATLRVGGGGGGAGGLEGEGHEQHPHRQPSDAVALCESLADEVRRLVATNHRIDGTVQTLLGTLRGDGNGNGGGGRGSGRSGAARSRQQAATAEEDGGRQRRRRRRQQEEDSEDEEEEDDDDESLAGADLFGLRNRRKRPKVGNNDGRHAGFADGDEKTMEARESVVGSLRADNDRLRRDLRKERNDKASLERELARVRDENQELRLQAPSRTESSTARGSSEKSKLGQEGKTASRSERAAPRNKRYGTVSDERGLAQNDEDASSHPKGRKQSPRLESSGKGTVRLQEQRSSAPRTQWKMQCTHQCVESRASGAAALSIPRRCAIGGAPWRR